MKIDILLYQSSRKILLALRSIHWFINILENRGIPEKIISQFRVAEQEAKRAALDLPYFDQLNAACEAEIDSFHCAEIPPSDRNQEHRWAEAKLKMETFMVLRYSIELYRLSIASLISLDCDLEQFNRALILFEKWLAKLTINEKSMSDIGAAIDSLNLDYRFDN